MKLTPTRFEVTDEEYSQVEATIELFDEATAKIDIKTVQSAESWTELATRIGEALKLMDLSAAVVQVEPSTNPEYDQV